VAGFVTLSLQRIVWMGPKKLAGIQGEPVFLRVQFREVSLYNPFYHFTQVLYKDEIISYVTAPSLSVMFFMNFLDAYEGTIQQKSCSVTHKFSSIIVHFKLFYVLSPQSILVISI
jgi:hypothetical protein